MDKKTFFVAIHQGSASGQILEDKDGSSFQFTIEATREEVNELQELFERAYEQDTGADYTATDDTLDEIYRMIYRLGNAETKQQIENMGVILS